MKKLVLNNLYESSTPPTDTRVLWVQKEGEDIKVIHRFRKGSWEPYLVSVEYLMRDTPKETK